MYHDGWLAKKGDVRAHGLDTPVPPASPLANMKVSIRKSKASQGSGDSMGFPWRFPWFIVITPTLIFMRIGSSIQSVISTIFPWVFFKPSPKRLTDQHLLKPYWWWLLVYQIFHDQQTNSYAKYSLIDDRPSDPFGLFKHHCGFILGVFAFAHPAC